METGTYAVDLSAVAALTDMELSAEFGAAQAAFAQARLSDPRRSGLAYSDAKLAVSVFGREIRRREQLAVAEAETIAAEAAAATCVDASCQAATSHVDECECRCEGAGHGIDHRAGRAAALAAQEARVWRTGDVYLTATASASCDDAADAAFGLATLPTRRAFVPYDEEAF